MKQKKILPPTYFTAAILVSALGHFIFPLYDVIDFPANLFGLIPLAISGLLNLFADRQFKRLGTTVKPFEYSSALATDGVFHLSRNPMYLGMTLFLLGEAILLGSILPFFIMIIFAFLMDRNFIVHEEQMLEEKFGEIYIEYKRKVRRWI